MLGRFLEFSILTPDIRASLDFYERLGFSQVQVGEAWPHPYAVLTDGRLCLGLHQTEMPRIALTFVLPGLLKQLDSLERRGVEFDYRRLGSDVFNEVGWLDPSGHLLRLVEARTFSPGKRRANAPSDCGYFSQIALPAEDVERAKLYWEQFGFVGMDALDAALPHVCCTSDTIDIGLHAGHGLRRPALLFDSDDPAARLARLATRGIAPGGTLPAALRAAGAALIVAPEGTPIVIAREADEY